MNIVGDLMPHGNHWYAGIAAADLIFCCNRCRCIESSATACSDNIISCQILRLSLRLLVKIWCLSLESCIVWLIVWSINQVRGWFRHLRKSCWRSLSNRIILKSLVLLPETRSWTWWLCGFCWCFANNYGTSFIFEVEVNIKFLNNLLSFLLNISYHYYSVFVGILIFEKISWLSTASTRIISILFFFVDWERSHCWIWFLIL